MSKHTRPRMTSILVLGLSLAFYWGCAQPIATPGQTDALTDLNIPPVVPNTEGFLGNSEICGGCHYDIYTQFASSGHPFALTPVSGGKVLSSINPTAIGVTGWVNPAAANASFITTLPYNLSWNDISYVLGGVNWKMNFVDANGRVITTGDGTAAASQPSQFNLPDPTQDIPTHQWANYDTANHSTRKDFNCGECHTTGFVPQGQGSLPGLSGTWAAPGVQCEACHGPGNMHAASGGDPSLIQVDRTGAICQNCHDAGGKFCPDKPHAGAAGPVTTTAAHGALACSACHESHAAGGMGTGKSCQTCHSAQSTLLSGSSHNSVFCNSCHDTHTPLSVTNTTCKQCHETQFTKLASSPHSSNDCITCHNGHTPSTPVPTSTCATCHTTQATQLAGTPHANATCGSCHDAHSPATPVSSTACNTCHSAQVTQLAGSPHQNATCGSCHNAHSPATPVASTACNTCHSAQVTQLAASPHKNATCASCHNAHSPATPVPSTACNTCHSAQFTQLASTPHRNATCGSCHNAHSPASPVPSTACQTCHGTQFTAVSGAQHNAISCKDCHTPHAPATPVTETTCKTCHSTEFTQVNATRHTAIDCTNCHNGHTPVNSNISAACTSCHGNPSSPVDHTPMNWSRLGYTCVTCHVPHQVNTTLRSCTYCHGPGG